MKLSELEITAVTFPDAGPGRTKYKAQVTHDGRIVLWIQLAPSGVYDWQSHNFVGDDNGPMRSGSSATVLDGLIDGLIDWYRAHIPGGVPSLDSIVVDDLLREERRQLRTAQR